MSCVFVSGNITVTGLVAPCTVPVDIYRDGVKLTTLSVNVASSGVVPFAFTDENAVTSHTYRAEVVNATCGCTGSTAVSVWNSSDVPPIGGGSVCTGTITVQSIANGVMTLLASGSPVAGNYTIGGAGFGTYNVNITGDGTFTVPITTATGTYCITASGPAGCSVNLVLADSFSPTPPSACGTIIRGVTVYVNSAVSCAMTLAVVIEQGASAYAPPSTTQFNSALQNIKFTVTGRPGAKYRLVATGTVNDSSSVFTLDGSGTAVLTQAVGQTPGLYNTNWKLVAETSGTCTPQLTNPGGVTITGSTCISLDVAKNGTDHANLAVYNPYVPLPATLPFHLLFSGGPFGGDGLACSGGVPVTDKTIGSDEPAEATTGKFTITNFGPYATGINLCFTLTNVSSEHTLCGGASKKLSF